MMKKGIGLLLFSLLVAAIGAVGGYLARGDGGGGDAHAHEDDGGGEDDHDHPHLDADTLANLGVRSGTAVLGLHTVTMPVQAVVEDPGLGVRRLVTPVPGVVDALLARPGAVVAAGDSVVRVVRDAFSRAELTHTAALLAPLDEELHDLAIALRREQQRLELATAEADRLGGLWGDGASPLVDQEALIRAKQELARARQSVAGVEFELHYHGFTHEQIEGIAKGAHVLRTQDVRKRALEHHGLWSQGAAAIFEGLPAAIRERAWTVAALGELQAQGLLGEDVVRAFAESEALRARFADATHLLLGGMPAARVAQIAASGALAPVFDLRAPADAEDWDVTGLAVRVGDRVDVGDVVANLDRPQEMWLRLEPFGAELTAVDRACREGTAVRAVPLTPGAGPERQDLTIDRVESRDQVTAVVVVENTSFRSPSGSRSWALRAGTRYQVLLPVRTVAGIVLPVGAITRRGADNIAFESHGDHFHELVVRVLHEDDEVVVLPPDGRVKPGDEIVVAGAFALGQALQIEGGGGHHHPH